MSLRRRWRRTLPGLGGWRGCRRAGSDCSGSGSGRLRGSASATTLLISAYLGSATGSRSSGLALGAVLAAAYGIMYLVLREDEYALLAGALISFVTIAATMYATRRIDWARARPEERAA